MATKRLNLTLALGLLSATAAFSTVPAFAGDCPAGQAATTDIQEHPSKPVGVVDTVLSAIDLSSKGEAWKGNMLRLRKLVVQPGGVVPWHEHNVRPANIIVVEGSITEYASTCKVGIEHPAGDVDIREQRQGAQLAGKRYRSAGQEDGCVANRSESPTPR